MTQLELISKTQEENNRKNLISSIKKKRRALKKLVLRTEMLKIKLDMLKREYMVKIGSLIAKDNHLDLDIIRFRNLIRLMEDGMSHDNAIEELKSKFYTEQLEIDKEEEYILHEERIYEKSKDSDDNDIQQDTKKLWKRLIGLYHPDLTRDQNEKKRREFIMKQINMAYEEGDISRLSKIEHEHTTIERTSSSKLEDIFISLENEIIEQEKQFILLKESEWYKWHIKIIRRNTTIKDIFSDVEKKLLDDIVAKMEIVKELKKKIEAINLDVSVRNNELSKNE